jgi:hypothetical protein
MFCNKKCTGIGMPWAKAVVVSQLSGDDTGEESRGEPTREVRRIMGATLLIRSDTQTDRWNNK